jgi:cysteine sulfinate desulfinase/cysteine desulfurase-like protein
MADERANASIRVGIGRFNTAADIDFAADTLATAVSRLQGAR